MKKLNVAILGSGNIGTDLLLKILRSDFLHCSLFIGRRENSPGIVLAKKHGVKTSIHKIDAIINDPDCCDLVFDCTSARNHAEHWPILKELGKVVIDMTPSMIGEMYVPVIDKDKNINDIKNINMISCGGQASIPLANAISRVVSNIEYIEVMSSISSKSAGPGTRLNLDEYIQNTEAGLSNYTNCNNVKVMLVLNPAIPEIDMQTTVSVKVDVVNMEAVRSAINDVVLEIDKYVPGYKLAVSPIYENDRIFVSVKVRGIGDYLPKYAGNLDIINSAAIAAAENLCNKSGDDL